MRTIHLADDELQDAAEAARVACAEAERHADKQGNANSRASFDAAARRYRELADRFERALYGRRQA